MSLDIDLIETSPHSVFSTNITHNLNKMADAAGIYQALWRPEEIPITTARELSEFIVSGIADLKARPEYYKKFDSLNGWGTYDNFLPWLEELLGECRNHPAAILSISR